MVLIFLNMQPWLRTTDDWTYVLEAVREKKRLKWLVVLRVCTSWRYIGLSFPVLWPVVISVNNKVYGLVQKLERDLPVPRLPGRQQPWRIILDRSGPNKALLDALLPHTPRDQAVLVSVDGETTAHYLYKRVQEYGTRLQAIAVGSMWDDALEVPTIEGRFDSLEVLGFSCWSTYRNLTCTNLRKLRIGEVEYREAEQLRQLVAFIQAMPALADISFENVIAYAIANNNTNEGHPGASALRHIEFWNTIGVSTLLEWIGIPYGVHISANNIYEGDILPQNDALLGSLAGYETAAVRILGNALKVTVYKDKSVLDATWWDDDQDWAATAMGLLGRVLRMIVKGEEGGVDMWKLFMCATKAKGLYLLIAEETTLCDALLGLVPRVWTGNSDNEDDADDDEGGDDDDEGENGDENDENGGGADEAYGAARGPLWYIPLPDLKDIYVAADYAWDKIPRLFIQVFVQREGLGYTVKGGCLVEGDFRSSRPVTGEVPEAWRRADADLQKYIDWMRMMH